MIDCLVDLHAIILGDDSSRRGFGGFVRQCRKVQRKADLNWRAFWELLTRGWDGVNCKDWTWATAYDKSQQKELLGAYGHVLSGAVSRRGKGSGRGRGRGKPSRGGYGRT